jgi:hypothetical protein
MKHRNNGHWTKSNAEYVRSKVGSSEKKLKNGQWIKISKSRVVTGDSRSEVRAKIKA